MTDVKTDTTIIPMEPALIGDETTYTIDQLARLTGVTARNIRAHQARGLLAPPAVRGRTGYYGPEHLSRIRLILQLQNDGYNLKTIARILKAIPPDKTSEVFDFERALRKAWQDEAPEIHEAAELASRFGVEPDDAPIGARALRFGVLRPLEDGRFEARSPALLQAGAYILFVKVCGHLVR